MFIVFDCYIRNWYYDGSETEFFDSSCWTHAGYAIACLASSSGLIDAHCAGAESATASAWGAKS
jgi:hypothetical protein